MNVLTERDRKDLRGFGKALDAEIKTGAALSAERRARAVAAGILLPAQGDEVARQAEASALAWAARRMDETAAAVLAGDDLSLPPTSE